MTTLFDATYEQIAAFVSRPENARLQAGTGRYSTLFRGSLCGSTESSVVSQRLASTPVNVLWLGSNPNVPESLANIVADNPGDDFQHFLAQKRSGHFSEVVIDDRTGASRPGWDPINAPPPQWKFYTEVFDRVYGPGGTLMANYVPWGSRNFPQLLRQVAALDKALLARMLDFSTQLNRTLIEALKPELVVVPKSLNRAQLKDSHLFSAAPAAICRYRIEAKVPFIFNVNEIRVGNHQCKVLISPHPAYTPRLGKAFRQPVQAAMAKALR